MMKAGDRVRCIRTKRYLTNGHIESITLNKIYTIGEVVGSTSLRIINDEGNYPTLNIRRFKQLRYKLSKHLLI